MNYEGLLKGAWNFQKDNIVTYAVATLIVAFGSILIITSAPLIYGLMYMAVKGSRSETVQIDDVFEGFRNGNFIRSWTYALIPIVIFVAYIVVMNILTYIFSIISSILAMLVGFILSIAFLIVSIALGIVFLFGLPLLVTREYSGIDAAKESIELIKANPTESVVTYIVLIILNILGSIPFVSLVTTPLSFMFLSRVIMELPGGATQSGTTSTTTVA